MTGISKKRSRQESRVLESPRGHQGEEAHVTLPACGETRSDSELEAENVGGSKPQARMQHVANQSESILMSILT